MWELCRQRTGGEYGAARYIRGLAQRVSVHAKAAEPTATHKEHLGGPERRRDYQSGCASKSWMRYPGTVVPQRASLPEPDTEPGWGMARVDREWEAALEAALTATRRNDLQHGQCRVRSWLRL